MGEYSATSVSSRPNNSLELHPALGTLGSAVSGLSQDVDKRPTTVDDSRLSDSVVPGGSWCPLAFNMKVVYQTR